MPELLGPAENPLPDAELCGRFVAWIGSALAGRVDAAVATAAVEAGSDGHVVTGWPDGGPAARIDAPELSLDELVMRLADAGVRQVALALPVAGDPVGVTGTGAFGRAALEAECGVVLGTGLTRFGLVPAADRRGSSYRGWRWRVFAEPVDPAVDVAAADPFAPVGSLAVVDPHRVVEQADRALSRALRAATDELAALDLAQWRPEVAAGRKEAEAALRAAGQRMPPDWPAPARALAERSLALWRIVRVARADSGAVSASGSQARGQALAALSHAVREAAMAAYNVPVLSLPVGQAAAVEIDLARRPPR
ncbi:MAG: hypothetical protein QOC73_931 [Actinomycetota bacterium]|nr:hypothetical protein [Actinomycetota bacterium]